MSIKEAIQQQHFRSERQKAMINILYTNNWLLEHVRSMLKNEDLTSQQYNVLRILRGSAPEPLSTLQIRARMLDKMSDTSRIVDRLVIKGLVEKNPCENDKRLVDVRITAAGQEKLAQLDEKEMALDKVLLNLSEEEAQLVSDLLDKARNGAEAGQ